MFLGRNQGPWYQRCPGRRQPSWAPSLPPAGPPTAPLKGSYSGVRGGPSAKPGIVHLPSSGQVSPEFTGVATSGDIVSPPKLWYTEGSGLRHPAAELEGVIPITTGTAPLIKGPKLIGGQGHYYTQEGAPPLTRAQARMAIARQVMEDLRLRPRRGLKVLTPEKAAREDLAVHTLDDLTRGGPMDADPLRQPFTPPAAQLPTAPTMQFKVDRIRPPQMTGEGVGIVVRAPEDFWDDGRDSSRREGATHPPRDRSSSTPPSGGTGSTSFPAARENCAFCRHARRVLRRPRLKSAPRYAGRPRLKSAPRCAGRPRLHPAPRCAGRPRLHPRPASRWMTQTSPRPALRWTTQTSPRPASRWTTQTSSRPALP